VGEFRDHGRQQAGGLADSFAPARLLREGREHADQVGSGVADPFPVGRDSEEVLGNEQAHQFGVVEGGFPAGVVISGKAERGEDSVVEMDVQCGQEGVEVSFHTPGLTPFVLVSRD
jgi:hypothetical protein